MGKSMIWHLINRAFCVYMSIIFGEALNMNRDLLVEKYWVFNFTGQLDGLLPGIVQLCLPFFKCVMADSASFRCAM